MLYGKHFPSLSFIFDAFFTVEIFIIFINIFIKLFFHDVHVLRHAQENSHSQIIEYPMIFFPDLLFQLPDSA